MRFVYLFLLGILLISYGCTFRRVIRSSEGLTPLLGWLAGLGYFLLSPLALITVLGGYALPPAYDVGQDWHAVTLTNARFLVPFLVVWLCLMGACLAVQLFHVGGRQEARDTPAAVSRQGLERAILITMGLTVVNWTLLVWLVGGIEEFLISHWQQRGEDLVARLGDSYVLADHLFRANQVVFTAAAALYTGLGLKNRDTNWKFTSLIILFFLLEVVLTGNRIYFAIYLIAFFILCLQLRRKKTIIVMLAASPVLILVFSAWSSVRHNLTEIPDSVADYNEADFGNRTTEALINVTEGINSLLMLHIINDFGNRQDYLYGLTYSRAATSLIPRRFYPQKPENFTLMMANLYLPGEQTSLNATAVGEMYANFGPFSLLLFPLLTAGIALLTQRIARAGQNHAILPVLLFATLVWAARSTVEDNFVCFLLAMFLIFVLRLDKGLRRAPERCPAKAYFLGSATTVQESPQRTG